MLWRPGATRSQALQYSMKDFSFLSTYYLGTGKLPLISSARPTGRDLESYQTFPASFFFLADESLAGRAGALADTHKSVLSVSTEYCVRRFPFKEGITANSHTPPPCSSPAVSEASLFVDTVARSGNQFYQSNREERHNRILPPSNPCSLPVLCVLSLTLLVP